MEENEKDEGLYTGGAFHKDFNGEKLSGIIKIYSGQLVFDSKEKKITFPLHNLLIRKGGANNRLIFFEHSFFPGSSIFTSDKSILKSSYIKENDGSKKQIKGENRKSVKRTLFVLLMFLFIIGVFYGLLQLKNPLINFIAKKIPAEWEKTIGKTVLDQYKSGKEFLSDPFIIANIRKITDPILDSINSEKYKFFINISNDQSINAFALPGGNIVINTGLILAVDTPEELAGVLAHEIAHVILQHGLKRIIGSAGMSLVISSVFGDTKGLLAIITDNGSYLLDRKFSREYEREADRRGLQILLKANVNPEGMVSFFNKLEGIEKGRGDLGQVINKLSFLSTHPETEERINKLSKMLRGSNNNKTYHNFKINLKEFQKELKEKLYQKKWR